MERAFSRHIRLFVTLVAAAASTAALSACSAANDDPDKVAGKQAFVEKCGSCHTLARAGTKGTSGPNLDEAFHQSRKEGFGESAIRGVVAKQIEYPSVGARACEPDCVRMPADLVEGQAVDDVAAYVAMVAGAGGKDSGLLATAVKAPGSGRPAVARDGVLSIPADPGGQLAYVTEVASAPAGSLRVESPNESSTPHDIVIDGKGKGETVADGGVSRFSASFAAGRYTYFCSLPGHREAGMEGRLTVR